MHLNVSAPSVLSSSATCVESGGVATAETSTISFDSLSQHIGMYVEEQGGQERERGERKMMMGMILAGRGESDRRDTEGAGAGAGLMNRSALPPPPP
ncbi:hypothetical protein EVG20_g7654 [Dentipellis fragilis]|uniref:Uncharacterized protein n=1 Tax=Dentipellis fragilis TaxID=205917 RepID=A0A4Y9YDL3_9AGAM|nr:hypothetical protein EVG20_g7654 [Dentipellis fragilis]